MSDLSELNKRLRAVVLLWLCACCFVCVEVRGAWRAAGNVVAVAREPNGVTLTLSSGARARVTFHDLQVVRVRLAPRGTFEREHSYAVESRDRKTVDAVVREVGRNIIEITTKVAGPKIVIEQRPFFVRVYDAGGQLVVEDDAARPTSFDLESGAIETSKRRDELEFYYGLGEKALMGARQGQTLSMWNTDTYAYPVGLDPIYQSIPFFIALKQGKAYGLFFDNTYRTYFDMGKFDPTRYTFGAAGGELNYYVFTGGATRTPKEVLRQYTELTGRTPLPPLWALGYQQSRWSYFPETVVRDLARNFRERRIPADVIYLDIDYMDGFRVFTWDKQKFPDPSKLLRDLRADGFRTVLIIDPGIKVDENYFAYREGRAQGLFCKAADGSEFHGTVWPGVCAFPDFTNAQARAWFGSLYRTPLDEGVSGFWNDMNEPANFASNTRPPQPSWQHDPAKTFPLDVRHAGDGQTGPHARYHNVYGMQMARATFEGVRQLRPDARPFVLTRAGYAGVQRYSAVWTGDNVPSWEHLALSIPMLAHLSVSGVPFVGADIGGFADTDRPTPELYTRWLQAAALTPFCRAHYNKARGDREPWSFGADFEKLNRAAIELRYQLLPYLYTVFQQHTETGAPVMRPLWFNYPTDFNTYDAHGTDEYLVGDDLLVAPVVQAGAVERNVYFPQGDAWLDWWTGARYEGGKAALIPAPLNRLPLFVRAGAAVPVQPVVQHTGEMARAPLTFVVAGGANGAGRLYEDAGDGYDYRRGAWRTTNIMQTGATLRFTRAGSFNNARTLVAIEFLGLDERPQAVQLDGRAVKDFSFDRTGSKLRVPLPQQNVNEIVLVP